MNEFRNEWVLTGHCSVFKANGAVSLKTKIWSYQEPGFDYSISLRQHNVTDIEEKPDVLPSVLHFLCNICGR